MRQIAVEKTEQGMIILPPVPFFASRFPRSRIVVRDKLSSGSYGTGRPRTGSYKGGMKIEYKHVNFRSYQSSPALAREEGERGLERSIYKNPF